MTNELNAQVLKRARDLALSGRFSDSDGVRHDARLRSAQCALSRASHGGRQAFSDGLRKQAV